MTPTMVDINYITKCDVKHAQKFVLMKPRKKPKPDWTIHFNQSDPWTGWDATGCKQPDWTIHFNQSDPRAGWDATGCKQPDWTIQFNQSDPQAGSDATGSPL